MKLAENVELKYEGGELVLEAKIQDVATISAKVAVAKAAVPVLDGIRAKVESGEIDPIKGTDLDKEAMLKAIDFLKAEMSK